MRKLLSRVAIIAIASASALYAEQNAGATKNITDLSGFAGTFSGRLKIAANDDTFRGHARITPHFEEVGLSGTFNIRGSVRADGEKVPVRQTLRFRTTGRVDISELAPAVSSGVREKGYYVAPDGRSINFQGKFSTKGSQGNIEGTYTCKIRMNGQRILRMTYSVTLDGDAEPSFVYKYIAKPNDDAS